MFVCQTRGVQTIGLVGGHELGELGASTTSDLNLGVEERLGGLHGAKTVMSSVEFAEVTASQDEERWDEVAESWSTAARGVEPPAPTS